MNEIKQFCLHIDQLIYWCTASVVCEVVFIGNSVEKLGCCKLVCGAKPAQMSIPYSQKY